MSFLRSERFACPGCTKEIPEPKSVCEHLAAHEMEYPATHSKLTDEGQRANIADRLVQVIRVHDAIRWRGDCRCEPVTPK